MQETDTTLAIDFGSKNIGVALVSHKDGRNIPLFAGTIVYEPFKLKKDLNPRAILRHMRRTRKTKRARLRKLSQGLIEAGLNEEQVKYLLAFCRRRGWKSLFGEKKQKKADKEEKKKETLIRFSREDFFLALENAITERIPTDKQDAVLGLCAEILNRAGNPRQEMRLMRIDNRGVSRCAWDGCQSVTPRRQNAVKDALNQFVYLIIDIDKICKDPGLRQELDKILDDLVELGKRHRHAGGDEKSLKIEHKALHTKMSLKLDLIKNLSHADTWSKNRLNILNILKESVGRNSYCREHSALYIQHVLDRKIIPFKKGIMAKDIHSRREQVLFQKLWRYLEARLLPLVPRGIDQLVVERVAFDLLSGSWKKCLAISDKDLEGLYQQGPRYTFSSTLEMLKTEFDGHCAYCGKQDEEIIEVEHILPKREFIFDGYLNLLPACPTCNRLKKSGRSPAGAGLTIHKDAYEAYERYYRQITPHYLHTAKKGILKLMTDKNRTWQAEQYLALIAKNIITISGAQRSPRPLARYLSQKLQEKFNKYPEIRFRSGRHTALWRYTAYPEFDKIKEKEEGGVINHAVDALILASKLPDIAFLEAKNLPVKDLKAWSNQVQSTAPAPGPDGVPIMPYPEFAVPAFEEVLPGNYIKIDLSFLNWNYRDCSVHRESIFGWNRHEDLPTMRTAAAELVKDFRKGETKDLKNIAHPHLRKACKKAADENPGAPGKAAAEAMITWLRKSIKGSSRIDSEESVIHPSARIRHQLLKDFVEGKMGDIPAIIGITMLRPHDAGSVDLERWAEHEDQVIHRYRTDPSIVAKIVGYRKNKTGLIDRQKPLIFELRQNLSIKAKSAKIPPIPDGLLKGRALGRSAPDKTNWLAALEGYLRKTGIAEYAMIRKGNVVLSENGSSQYIRNFSSTQGFKNTQLYGIISVKRSPFVNKAFTNKVL